MAFLQKLYFSFAHNSSLFSQCLCNWRREEKTRIHYNENEAYTKRENNFKCSELWIIVDEYNWNYCFWKAFEMSAMSSNLTYFYERYWLIWNFQRDMTPVTSTSSKDDRVECWFWIWSSTAQSIGFKWRSWKIGCSEKNDFEYIEIECNWYGSHDF